jgi:hypothetical protein
MTLICKHDPEATHRSDNVHGSLPIHLAAADPACHADVLEWLFRQFPASAIMTDQWRYQGTPLHVAVRARNWEAVRILLRVCPESTRIPDCNGLLPLHLALVHVFPINAPSNQEIIRLLLRVYPQAAEIKLEKDAHGTLEAPTLPLHIAISRDANPVILDLLIRAHPTALDCPNILHRALDANYHTDGFSLLLEKCPEESLQSEWYGLTPLQFALSRHTCARRNPCTEIQLPQIDLLLNKLPHLGYREMGKLLRWAIRDWGDEPEQGAELIQYWVNRYPESTQLGKDDEQGWLPLHCAAAAAHVSTEVVQILMQSNPKALQTPDRNGRLPLHVLLAEHDRDQHNRDFISILQLFLNQFPAGVTWADHKGYWPLHLACKRGHKVRIIQMLVTVCPHAVRVELPNHRGEIPLLVACQAPTVDLDSILFLVQRSPELFLRKLNS